MIASMTGFGRGFAQQDGVAATVELRSVNNRYVDVSVRLPQRLSAHETDVQTRLKDAFERGRIKAQVQVEKTDAVDLAVRVNHEAARAYGQLLEEARQAAGIDAPVRLADVLRYGDVFTAAEDDPDETERIWQVVRQALDSAIDALRTMRLEEGRALLEDLSARNDAIEALLIRVEERAPDRVDEARDRLRERLGELMEDARINPERLEQEIAIVADKLDITEECVRLHSHLSLFREALANDAAVGRKLNFITQEIHREVNTIGSKANDPEIARYAVQMKEEVEKIREQVQNVE
jgi:uncharacterized protein (TIGR00255 family)